MTEKTYKVKVYRTVQQRAWVEVCTDIKPIARVERRQSPWVERLGEWEGQAFYDIVDEEVFQLEDNEWDTVEVFGPYFFDVENAKEVGCEDKGDDLTNITYL